MISFEKWDKWVDDFDTYWGKRKARVTCVDGSQYEGICNGYGEEEDSNGDNVWGIILGARGFIQEQVEKIEFIDDDKNRHQ